ncbi:MAG: stage II sporulation protein R [Clostridia bacterium]|nr:stage II sporulation protein R [Clostridia bacterium]
MVFKKIASPCLSALAAFLAAVVMVTANISAYAVQCEDVRREVLRLHVVANSDSETDQNVKLLVRDALLAAGGTLLSQAQSAEQAAALARHLTDTLQQRADEVLAENGFDYTSRVTVQKEYFETRTYEDLTLPAGVYMAVRVVLGDGDGQNWWCVMFPPLCLPAACTQEERDVFTKENKSIVAATDGYEIRFRIVEVIEQLREKFRKEADG